MVFFFLLITAAELRWINCLFPVIPEYLKVRSHDPEEAIRHDVIVTIINAGKKDLNLVNDQLLGFVRERTLDKRVSSIPVEQVENQKRFLAIVLVLLKQIDKLGFTDAFYHLLDCGKVL